MRLKIDSLCLPYVFAKVITYFAFVGSSAPAKKTGKEDPNAKKKASLEDQVRFLP